MNYYEILLRNKKEILNSLGSGYYADLLREKYNDFPDHDGRPGQVGGSLPRNSTHILTKEQAQELLSSDWKTTILDAIKKLPKSKNGRPYLQKDNLCVDVPNAFAGESKKEIFLKSKTKEEKIGALWAIKNMQDLFDKSLLTERTKDRHSRDGVKEILRYEVAFPLQIDNNIFAFNSKFTVRVFEEGYKVLSPEILEINKGLDLRVYAMSTQKRKPV